MAEMDSPAEMLGCSCNDFYRTIMDQARDSILVVAADGKIIDANQAALKAYGYTIDEIRALRVHDLNSADMRAEVDAKMNLAQQEGVQFRTHHVRRSGKTFPVEVSSRRVQFAAGAALVSIVRDITDTVAFEKAYDVQQSNFGQLHEELSAAYEELTVGEQEFRRQNSILTLLRETAIGLMQSLDMQVVLTSIVSGAADLIGTSHGFINILDEEGAAFERKIGLGHYASDVGRRTKLGEGFSSIVYKSGEITIVDNYSKAEDRLAGSFFDSISNVALVPLKQNHMVIGVFGLAFLDSNRTFSAQEVSLLVKFAELASIALGNARLYSALLSSEKKLQRSNEELTAANEELLASEEELRQQFDELITREEAIRRQNSVLQLLHDTARGLMHRQDPEELLAKIVCGATELLATPDGFIYQLDMEKQVFRRTHGTGIYAGDIGREIPLEQGIVGTVYQTGEPVVIDEYAKWRALNPASAQFPQLCSVLQTPLKSEGKVIGTIGLSYCDPGRKFGRTEIEGLNQFAELGSIALDNAMLIASLQKELLERKAQEQAVWRLAYYDSLTGLPNRVFLQECFARELAKTQHQANGVVLHIDLDDLKMINDTLGHSYGDGIIAKAAARIHSEAGDRAVVARIGGDEFMVLLAGQSDRNQVTQLAERMVKLLSRDYEIGEARIHLSASIGIAFFPPDGNTPEELFKNADLALYAAKSRGKGTWCFYEAELQRIAYENMIYKRGLRRAIERQELVLHYQPLVDAHTGRIVSFEALLRWVSPEHGLVPPSRFIPLAEESDIIRDIGKWVLEEACRFARSLAEKGKSNTRVSVNVSPRQLVADNFAEQVRRAIDQAGIRPDQLELEITENALISSLEDSNHTLSALRDIGVQLSLDDFGTGYSSLTYLRRLPVEKLKIDKSFVDQILADETQSEFISSIVNMAHVLQMSVVAEGVETEEQLRKLKESRCDFIQGYIFSRPVSADEAVLL